MRYGCIGKKLTHSFSKEIHALLGNEEYELCEIPPEALDAFLTKKEFTAINVTIPYKEAVLPYLFETDEGVRRIGAANTVVNRGGKLYGYNTDFYGMRALFSHLGLSPAGKKVAILGTGGTSKTARAVAESLGAKEILRIGRTGKEGALTYEALRKEHNDIEILINTTPVGMFPNAEETPLDLSFFPSLCGVIDAVYNPLSTRLILEARERGIPAEGGLYMLIAQGVRASEIFLDTVYPAGTVERIYGILKGRKENIVLVGMPSSGKSTVGALLSARTGRPFVDTDERIKASHGAIPALFASVGEAGFRRIEAEIIKKEIAPLTGSIIATGGGSVLSDENVKYLLQNGRIYFLNRPLSLLTPTDDRPLSSDKEAMEARYLERLPRYRAACDAEILSEGTAEETATAILKEFEDR